MSADATAEQIRRAYHRRARALHPDRHAGSPTDMANQAARAMQDVNEAWRVLRDPGQRRAYDDRLHGRAVAGDRSRHFSGYDLRFADPDIDLDPRPYRPHPPPSSDDLGVYFIKGLPWVLLALVLGVVFVFTAYAGGGSDPEARAPLGTASVGECVRIQQGLEVLVVPCDQPSDGKVVAYAVRPSGCPSASAAHDLRGRGVILCLRRPDTDA